MFFDWVKKKGYVNMRAEVPVKLKVEIEKAIWSFIL